MSQWNLDIFKKCYMQWTLGIFFFLKIINAIYGQSHAKVRVNNLISENLLSNRGITQGSPLSPLLFAISVEPFANLIRSTSKIEGIKTGRKEFKISMFADDVILYTTNSSGLLDNITCILKKN